MYRIAFYLLFISLVSCKSTEIIVETPNLIETQIQCSSYHYGLEDEAKRGIYMFNSEADIPEWFYSPTSTKCMKELNFTDYTYLLVLDNVRGDLSHNIEFVKTEEFPEEIKVTVEYIINHGSFGEVMNQPYLLLLVPKTRKKVTLLSLYN